MAANVRVYTTSFCAYCVRAKRLLHEKGVEFEEVDVSRDTAAREWLVQATGGMRTVPVIFVGERCVGGFDELYALDRSGDLDPLLSA
jgi:glutaredoxin 3